MQKTTRILAVLGSVALAGAVSSAQAQQSLGRDVGGGFKLATQFQADTTYTDNFYYQPDNEQSATGLLLRPSLQLASDRGRWGITNAVGLEAGSFTAPTSQDDYVDGFANLGLDYQAGNRHRFSIGGGYIKEHDPFGTTRTEQIATIFNRDIDQWHQTNAAGKYRFGAADALINTEITLSAAQKRYDTNEGGPSGTRFLDHDTKAADVAFFYNFSPKTAVVIDALVSDVEFEEALSANRDGQYKRLRGGVRWNVTAQTSGDFRAGYFRRDFDDGGREEKTGANWNATLNWTPAPLTKFKLSTGRAELISFVFGTRFIDFQHVSASWSQRWTTRFTTETSVSFSQSDFIGSPTERSDDNTGANFYGQYQLQRALSVVGGLSSSARDSSDTAPTTNLDYDTLTAFLGIRITP